MDEFWAVVAITLNFSTELDSTDDCYMAFGEISCFKVTWCKQFKFLVFGNIKWVFRMFAFIQANIFFLKLKSILKKINISCIKS